jgi:4a-hydroxytetrahydrobiopterin dehydratase
MKRKRLSEDEWKPLLAPLSGWSVRDERLVKEYRFPDFAQGLAFVNQVGAIAEQMNHHPDVTLAWGRVVLSIWTHDAGGLTKKDFELASRCDPR